MSDGLDAIDDAFLRLRRLWTASRHRILDDGGAPVELSSLLVIEACVRLVPGVLGAAASLAEESFEDGLLEGPQFTRPRTFEGQDIPEVLLSGHHGEVARWRRRMREETTRERRPDLWDAHLAKSQPKGKQSPNE